MNRSRIHPCYLCMSNLCFWLCLKPGHLPIGIFPSRINNFERRVFSILNKALLSSIHRVYILMQQLYCSNPLFPLYWLPNMKYTKGYKCCSKPSLYIVVDILPTTTCTTTHGQYAISVLVRHRQTDWES